MKLQKPKVLTFIIALALVVVGLIVFFGKLSIAGIDAFWFVLVAYVLLALGTLFNGL